MIVFTTTLQKFGQQGEKTGWTYIAISAALAKKLKDEKKSFRVKGKIDDHVIKGVAVLPMGGGDFILPVNGEMRKGIRKQKGAVVQVQLEVDTTEIIPPEVLIECLKDEPGALAKFNSLTKGHQNYFTKWINSAKTEETKARRIAHTINFLAKGKDFGEMLRTLKKEKGETGV